MIPVNIAGDIVAIIASIVALIYVLGILRMVRASSHVVLLAAMLYMVVTRFVIIAFTNIPGDTWIEAHRSVVIIPQYVLFAVAFAMTYYELRDFRFDVPQNTNLVEYRVSLAGDVCKKIVCGVVLCATILGIMLWTCSAAMDDGHAQKITIQHQDNTNVWKSLGDRPPIVPRP